MASRALLALPLLWLVACPGGGSQELTTCGNGILDRGEACDDGNRSPTDGC